MLCDDSELGMFMNDDKLKQNFDFKTIFEENLSSIFLLSLKFQAVFHPQQTLKLIIFMSKRKH